MRLPENPKITLSDIKRFWIKVDCNGPIHYSELGKCWVWIAGKFAFGYGSFWFSGEMCLATHFSWTILRSEVPRDKWLLHKCDVPQCVNPEHLYLGTQLDNMRDKFLRNRDHKSRNVGTQNGQAKLKPEQVKIIRTFLNNNHSYSSIGRRFGVSAAAISKIAKGETWVLVI